LQKLAVRLTGCAEYTEYLSDAKPPKKDVWESPLERKARRHAEKVNAHKEVLKELRDKYDPHKDPNASGDPFKTLFVARISYDTTEKKLKREFEVFGSIKKVRMIYDQKGKPRGYAFIEYEHERDLKNSYKQGDGKKIDGRRVMVDVERGRTVEGWMPRRLGGGRGPGRMGKPSKKKKKKLAEASKAAQAKEDRDRDRDRDRKDDKPKDKAPEPRAKQQEKARAPPPPEKDRKRDRSRSRDRDDKKKKYRD
jgi:U1 small nuclear ribonucleoprotein